MVGAYGNIGAVIFLTIYSFTGAGFLFISVAIASVLTMGTCSFLKNPKGKIMEMQPDGSIEMLEVA